MSSKTRKFESLLEAVPEALVGMDQAGVIRFVNHQTESLFGYDRDELVGQPVQTLVPEYLWEVYSEHTEYFADPRSRSMGLDLQLSGRQQDGSELPVNISLSHIDTGDVLLGITAVDEVAGHAAALENSKLLAAIVENSNDAIIAKTLDGMVTSWNPAAERMYGYSSEEMLGQCIDRLSPEGRTGEIIAILARIKAGLDVGRFETLRVRKDGTMFPVLLTVSPIRDANGAVVGASTITRDVTEARQAFEAARSMIESSLDALVAISPEGLITDANEATVKATGIPRVELIGTAFSECFSEPKKANAIYQLVFEHGMAVDYPLTMRHRDGTLTEVLYNASVYCDAGGKVLGVFAAARDVTELRRTLEAAQRLAAIVESTDDAIIGTTLDGFISSWNAAATRMYGYSSQEIIGKPLELLSPKDRSGKTKDILAKVKAGEVVEHSETERVRKDGTVFPVSRTVSPIRGADGTVVGASLIARDRTEQVKARKALGETSRQYRLLAENASDLVVMTSPERVITWVSPSLTRSLGWVVEDLLGKRLLDLVHPDDAAATAGPPQGVHLGLEVTTPSNGFLMRFRTKCGQYRWMAGIATPVTDESGAFTGVVSGLRDVEDLVRARESAQGLSRELKTSNDSLRDFVAVASHDLRSPLVTIGGFAEVLTDNWAALSEEERLKYLGAIKRGVDRLSRLTNDLLTSARVEGAAEQARGEHVRLATALASYLEANREEAGAVAVTCSPELVAVVDPSHLTRILDNYLGNAFKYGEPPICIEVEPIGDLVELRVRDHGPGVPPEFVSQLFTKFSRAGTSTTRATQGTGLGLSIVKGLAEANHGNASYQQDEPNGGCFVVRLPAAVASKNSASPPGPLSSSSICMPHGSSVTTSPTTSS